MNYVHHTYMPKLTLSVDAKVVRGAKRYAAARGTSVSQLVERYLDLLSKPPKADDQTPVLRLLRGAAARRRTPPASEPEIPVKRLLLDLNVFLGVILDRPPDANVAAACHEGW
jgi:hypothetical protein